MTKLKKSNREEKKHSVLTPKEKKHAKQAKKHQGDSTPLLEHT